MNLSTSQLDHQDGVYIVMDTQDHRGWAPHKLSPTEWPESAELLEPMRASYLILAQHQPGKFRHLSCQYSI